MTISLDMHMMEVKVRHMKQGFMSFVDPRPDVPGYTDKLQGEDKIILSIRLGIADSAQLA
jgi:lipopolysaccharide/colanic/teichoic acid biosynthesis glycosyltransferase